MEEREHKDTNLDKEKGVIEKRLEDKVGEVLRKEMEGRVKRLYERGFGVYMGPLEIFDFLKITKSDREDRFIMVLYAQDEANHYHPRSYPGCDFYPMGFNQEIIRMVFRRDLEAGDMPRSAFHQTGVRNGPVADNYYDYYTPLCLEVSDWKDVEEIERLVQRAQDAGLREDIICGEAEFFKDILVRIENDDSLDFDYRSQYT